MHWSFLYSIIVIVLVIVIAAMQPDDYPREDDPGGDGPHQFKLPDKRDLF